MSSAEALPAGQAGLGRLLTRLERDPAYARQLLGGLPAPPGPAHRIGITGAPGVGKSTAVGRLLRLLREREERVGVIAVDPTSPLTGGALLGDRLRLAPPQDDPGLFIRSLGSRGSLGGVTPAASGVAAVLEAAGYGRVLIETVGVGQTGYDVVCLADTVLALFSPESGDALQLMKAGILEIGDVFAVNKADRPGAEALLKEIEFTLALEHGAESDAAAWRPLVVPLTASTGEGAASVLAALDAHRDWLAALPVEHPRRRRRTARELAFIVRSAADGALDGPLAEARDKLAARVHAGELELWRAADELRELLRAELGR